MIENAVTLDKRNQVVVIDNLFTLKEIEYIHEYFLRFDGWQFIFDDSPEDDTATYSLGRAIDQPNFGEFENFCIDYAFKRAGLPIPKFHRCVYNAFRFGDAPGIHVDGEHLDALSFLVYGNCEWNHSWGGETVFMLNDEISDIVIPKPGRCVIFPGLVPHGAKPLARNHRYPARYSAVFQYCPGQEDAMLAHAATQSKNTRPFPHVSD